MPELPEAERARALIAELALGREIAGVDDTDGYVCRPHAPGEIAAALEGRTLTAARRLGKSLWVETDGGAGPDLGLHLGMAGRIVVSGSCGERSAGDPKPTAAGRGWDRFTLHFADGGALILRDKRRLGRVVLEPDLTHLGPDAGEVGRSAFRERVGRPGAPLKARLMDQGVIAGVGNLLADEALWQAELSPLHPAGDLTDEELDRLRRVLRAAIRRAHRLGGVHTGVIIAERHADGACPRDGSPLRRAKVGGRTTWWCPECQR